MKKLFALCLLNICTIFWLSAQIKSPDEFLGYALGSHFTPHYKVVDYFKYVASATKNIKLIEYGKTNEGKPLLVGIISSMENMDRLEQIRLNNLTLASGLTKPNVNLNEQPTLLWLSYNVHGNEANSTETAMKVLYTLSADINEKTKAYLKNTVVIIDPCLNPDGRDRYVNFFNSTVGKVPNPNPSAREHIEPWASGRTNHYYFDLNRDWAWQTQIESQQRLALYNKWMPQVHVDFHEQSYNEPYYFAPAAEPVHQDITQWQKDFQVFVGKNNARYFDEQGWKYFTKERFDLLYPSYGDTYPLYNGAIGMTYEQGGIRGGLSVITNDGDTLTLKDRIAHHFATSISTLEIASQYHHKLMDEYQKYFQKNLTTAPGIYKTFIIKPDNLYRLKKLTELLQKNNIQFAFGGEKTGKAFSYAHQKEENFTVGRNDLVINVLQAKAVLINVLLEPQTFVTDSNTYDITAWALPYVYGLNAFASKESFNGKYTFVEEKAPVTAVIENPLGWVLNWGNANDLNLLIALQKANIKVRQANQEFTVNGKAYPSGSLLVLRKENQLRDRDVKNTILMLCKNFGVVAQPVSSGFVEKGRDFGSSVYPLIPEAKIAIASGPEVSSLNLGEVWFYLEHDLNLNVNLINTKDINNLDVNKINTLILADGSYSNLINDGLKGWIEKGGKLVLLEGAIESVIDKKGFEIKKKDSLTLKKQDKATANRLLYKNKDQDSYDTAIPGAIYRVNMDDSHPIAYGIGKTYYTLKTDNKIYEPLLKGLNVGLLNEKSFMAGLAGSKVKENLKSGLLIGVQDFGRGHVVYVAQNPLFRNFWESGKQLFNNIVFLGY